MLLLQIHGDDTGFLSRDFPSARWLPHQCQLQELFPGNP